MNHSDFGILIPFAHHLGVAVVGKEPGRVVLALDLRPEHLNSWQAAHGGVTMSLLDLALSMALRTTDPRENGAITVEMKVNFIAPGRQRLVAEGRLLHGGHSLATCEGEVRDGSGALVAKALGTFKLFRKQDEGR